MVIMTLFEPASTFSHLTISNELLRCKDLLQKMKTPDSILFDNKHSYTYLEKIANLEDNISALTNVVCRRAIELQGQEIDVPKMANSVEQCWAWIHQTSQMSQLHIKNAAMFHLFHSNAHELRSALDRIGVSQSNYLVKNSPKTILYEVKTKSTFVHERLAQYLHLWQQSDWLVSNCYTVTPIYIRNEDIQQATKAICLCNYESPGSKISADEPVILLDSSNPLVWTVRTIRGETLSIPSVACLIPGPDQKAVEMAFILRDALSEKWKTDLVNIQMLVIDLLQCIYEHIESDKITINPKCLDEFRKMMTVVENGFFDVGGNNHSNFNDTLLSCRRHLDKIQGSRGNLNAAEAELTLSDITNIRSLISIFNEHVKKCSNLLKKLNKHRPVNCPNIAYKAHPNQTDVEKIFNRLSLSSNDSSIADNRDDSMTSSQRIKCVSRLYWNLPPSIDLEMKDSREKFVNTATINNDMPITIHNDKRYSSCKKIMVQDLVKSPDQFSVRAFEVNATTSKKIIDTSVAYRLKVQSDEAQTEEADNFDDDLVIKKSHSRLFQSAPPPDTSKSNMSDSFSQTDEGIKSITSWTQTHTEPIRETAISYDLGKGKWALDSNTIAQTTQTENASPRKMNRDIQTDQKSFSNKTFQTDKQSTSGLSTQTLSTPLGETLISYEIQKESMVSQTSIPSSFRSTQTDDNTVQRMTVAQQTDRTADLINTAVQTKQKALVDGECQSVTARATHDTQTVPPENMTKHEQSQTGNLSYEVITRFLVNGQKAEDVEVLSVVWKSEDTDF